MSENGSLTTKLAFAALGLICTISLTLAGFSLRWQWEANSRLQALEIRLQTVAQDRSSELEIRAELARLEQMSAAHWKLHGWARDQINKLRTRAGMDVESWPDVGGR